MSSSEKSLDDTPIRITSSDDLEVFEEVGRGGFGIVYRGLIKSLKKEVAIKQIDLEKDLTDLIEINKEIQIISDCRLPQITSYYGSFVKNYKLWVMMEFVDGGSIFDLLKPGPITNEKIIAGIVKEILLALEYLHNQGKIHRDLKSQNILVNKEGDIKLTDFGVSTQLSSNFSKRNTTVGTPYWMAPEVILNNRGGHSFKADIWSLGCCCYEMLTGKPPLQKKHPPLKALRLISCCQQEEDFIKLINLSQLNIDAHFKDFLKCCFVENPKKRHSATKLLRHPFIVQNLIDRNKSLKQLISKKFLWNQLNNINKTQNFYASTEIYDNELNWIENDVEVKSVKDLDSFLMFDDNMNIKFDDFNALDREKQVNVIMRQLEKISCKAMKEINSELKLNPAELEVLGRLHSQMKSQERNILCLYLNCIHEELFKEKNRKLKDKTYPSNTNFLEFDYYLDRNLKNRPTLKNKAFTKFDEIEENLMNSWLTKMK